MSPKAGVSPGSNESRIQNKYPTRTECADVHILALKKLNGSKSDVVLFVTQFRRLPLERYRILGLYEQRKGGLQLENNVKT